MSAYMGVSNELGKDRSKIVFIGNIPVRISYICVLSLLRPCVLNCQGIGSPTSHRCMINRLSFLYNLSPV